MRRLVPVLLGCTLLMAPPAEAGIGSLLRAAAKVGAKAGKVGAGSAKVAKGGALLKGAKVLGVGLAAERVFLHAADDVGRVGVFVADAGDGALSVVMRGGDEATHSLDSFGRLVDDLDEMARVADDAGVDLYVDPSALGRLDHLQIGENTRVFLANTEGPSWPVRRTASGPEIGVGTRTYVRPARIAETALDLTMKLASHALKGDEARPSVVDTDCGDATTAGVALADAAPGEVVVLVAEAGAVTEADALELSARYGVDLVVLGLSEVCAPGEPAPPTLAARIARVSEASTLGELWGAAADELPLVIDGAREVGGQIVVSGAGLLAVHAVEPAAPAASDGDDDLPEWAKAVLGGTILVGVLGLKLFFASRRRQG